MRAFDNLNVPATILWILSIYINTVSVRCQNRGDIDIPEIPLDYEDDSTLIYEITASTTPTTAPPTSAPPTTAPPTTTTTTPSLPITTMKPSATPLTVKTTRSKTTEYIKPTPADDLDNTINLSPQQPPDIISDTEKSTDVKDAKDKNLEVNYIIAGTAVGVVVLIAIIATTLGVLASQGKFAPVGFGPVETAV